MLERLDKRAADRISGPAWDEIRAVITLAHSALVSPSESCSGELTTIFVKYVDASAGTMPYAVMWIKKSSSIVVGLTLPTTVNVPLLASAPAGCKYAGLTRYLCLKAGDEVPAELASWAKEAYRHCYGGGDAT